MRALRIVLITLVIIVAIAVAGGAVAYYSLNSRNFAQPAALAALESDSRVTVSTPDGTDWFVFTPSDNDPTTGLIIYPGGFVDPRAYAPIARAVAEAGFLVVIDPMPLNLAVTNLEAADAVISAFPEIDTWAIGGHSLGGAMAAEYAARNDGAVDGLVLWAAYPGQNTDLSMAPLEVVSVYGEADGVASIADVTGAAARLPSDTTFIAIPGGNHTQFGWYGDGLQRGDNPAEITREAQQEVVIVSTIELLQSLDRLR